MHHFLVTHTNQLVKIETALTCVSSDDEWLIVQIVRAIVYPREPHTLDDWNRRMKSGLDIFLRVAVAGRGDFFGFFGPDSLCKSRMVMFLDMEHYPSIFASHKGIRG